MVRDGYGSPRRLRQPHSTLSIATTMAKNHGDSQSRALAVRLRTSERVSSERAQAPAALAFPVRPPLASAIAAMAALSGCGRSASSVQRSTANSPRARPSSRPSREARTVTCQRPGPGEAKIAV